MGKDLGRETLSKTAEKSLECISAVLFLNKVSTVLDTEREILLPKDVVKSRKRSKVRAEEIVKELKESG